MKTTMSVILPLHYPVKNISHMTSVCEICGVRDWHEVVVDLRLVELEDHGKILCVVGRCEIST